jgi:hypothetical protein
LRARAVEAVNLRARAVEAVNKKAKGKAKKTQGMVEAPCGVCRKQS